MAHADPPQELRIVEDVVRPDPTLDNVWLTFPDRRPVGERRSSVVSPGHLPYTDLSLHPFDLEALPKSSSLQVFNERSDRQLEGAALGRSKSAEAVDKRILAVKRRHPATYSSPSKSRNSSTE